MRSFDEWFKKLYVEKGFVSSVDELKETWNAAIEEAIGAAWNADDGGDESGAAALGRAEENMEKLKQI